VLEFIARKISSNVRVLEGALTRLFALSDLVQKDITMELAQDCLADILKHTDKKVTMDEIIKKTCEYYNIRQSDLMSPTAPAPSRGPGRSRCSVQEADDALPARDRAQVRGARPHHDPLRRAQDRGTDAGRQPDRRGCRNPAPHARGLIGPAPADSRGIDGRGRHGKLRQNTCARGRRG
jgi:hypothetical protein